MKQARRTALWEQKLGVSADFYRSSTATSVEGENRGARYGCY